MSTIVEHYTLHEQPTDGDDGCPPIDPAAPLPSSGGDPNALLAPVHSWTYCSGGGDARETCIVTLSSYQSLRTVEADDSDGGGFALELLYLPAPRRAHSRTTAPVRGRFLFPTGALNELTVEGPDGARLPAGDTAAPWASASSSAVARDVVVFLSPAEVVVYTGGAQHHQPSTGSSSSSSDGGAALELFRLEAAPQRAASGAAALRWVRVPRAARLPRTAAGSSAGLLLLAPLPASRSPSAPSLEAVYVVADRPDKNRRTATVTAGVVRLSAAGGHLQSAPVAATATERDVALGDALLLRAGRSITPHQCHWKFLPDGPGIVAVLPMAKLRGTTVTRYAVPRLLGAHDGTAAVVLHQRAIGFAPGGGGADDAAAEAIMDDLLSGDAEDIVERLTTDHLRVYSVDLRRPLRQRTADAADAPAALLFALAGYSPAPQWERRQAGRPSHGDGLYAVEVAGWATMLDATARAAAAIATQRVPQRSTVWAATRLLSLSDGSGAAASAATAVVSPYAVVPTTADAAGPAAPLCFPAAHAMNSAALRISYVHTPQGAAAVSLVCHAADAALGDGGSVRAAVESLLAVAATTGGEEDPASRKDNEEREVEGEGKGSRSSGARAAFHILARLWDTAAQHPETQAAAAAVERAVKDMEQQQQRQRRESGRRASHGALDGSFAALAEDAVAHAARDAAAAASLPSLAAFLHTAVCELLGQADWLACTAAAHERFTGGDAAPDSFMVQLWEAAASFFLAGAYPCDAADTIGGAAPLMGEGARAAFYAVLLWAAAEPTGVTANGGLHPRQPPLQGCRHWTRRMVALYLCHRRESPLELPVEDIFAAAVAAGEAGVDQRRSMEIALLQLVDDSRLLALTARLAATTATTPGQPAGLLRLADLLHLCGVRPCPCCGSDGTAACETGAALLCEATALSPASARSPSGGFTHLLLDAIQRLRQRAAADTPGQRIIDDVQRHWAGLVAGLVTIGDDPHTGTSGGDPDDGADASGAPIALPPGLCGGPCWGDLRRFPWCALAPLDLFDLFAALSDRLVQHGGRLGADADGADDGVDSAWRRYWRCHGSSLQQLREGAHLLRWLADGDGDIATDLVSTMVAVAQQRQQEGERRAGFRFGEQRLLDLSAFYVVLHSRSGSHIVADGRGSADGEEAVAVARVLHLAVANAPGRLTRRLVAEGLLQGGSRDNTALAALHTAQAGGEALLRSSPSADGAAHPEEEEESAAESLERLATAVWSFTLQTDPEAATNAVLCEKLLDACLWLRQRGEPARVAPRVFAFLRIVFLYLYPQQRLLVEAELQAVGRPQSPRRRPAGSPTAATGAQSYAQWDGVSGDKTAQRRLGIGEVAETTHGALRRLLGAFAEDTLSLRCLDALFQTLPSPADRDDRDDVHGRGQPPNGDDGDGWDGDATLRSRGDGWADDASGSDGGWSATGGSFASTSWFCLSPATAYFTAGQIAGRDVGRFALAGQLIRREMKRYVLSGLFARRIFAFDARQAALRGRAFDCRQFINDMADECDRSSQALSASAPLYDAALMLLLLDVVEELVVSTADDEDASLYPAETVAEMRRCVSKAGHKVYHDLHADEKRRVLLLLRPAMRPYLEPAGSSGPAAAADEALLDYQLSPVHQHTRTQVVPAIAAKTAEMRRRLASVPPPDTPPPPPPPPPLQQQQQTVSSPRGNAAVAAAAVVAGLSGGVRSALGVRAPRPTEGAEQSATTATTGASLSLQLVAKEEAARRRQLEAALASEYLAFIGGAEASDAIAAVYVALRYEARRRDLVRHVGEQHDIIATFEYLYRDRVAQWRAEEGHALLRAARVRHADALEALWRDEAECRAAIETECYTVKNALFAGAAAQEECMDDEAQLRREWELIEAEDRAHLARHGADSRAAALNRQADREEEEEWARLRAEEEREEAGEGGAEGAQPAWRGGRAKPKNAFLAWQEKQLGEMAEPADPVAAAPPPPRATVLPPPQQQRPQGPPAPPPRAAAAAPPDDDDPVAAGFSRVVEVGEGLFGAFSVLQSKIRETVAPAPQQQQNAVVGGVSGVQPEARDTHGGEDEWGWGDDDDDDDDGDGDNGDQRGLVQPAVGRGQPPQAAPAVAANDGDGWDWSEHSDDDKDSNGSNEQAATKPAERQGNRGNSSVVMLPPQPTTAAAVPRTRRGRGLGAVAEAVVPIQAPAQHLGVVAADGDGWGWEDHEEPAGSEEKPAATAPVERPPAEPHVTAIVSPSRQPPVKQAGDPANATEEDGAPPPRRKKRGGLGAEPLTSTAAAVAAAPSMEATVPVPAQPLPSPPPEEEAGEKREGSTGTSHEPAPAPSPTVPETPNPVRSIFRDVTEACDEEAKEAEQRQRVTQAAAAHLAAVLALGVEESRTRGLIVVDEIWQYQRIKRSIVLTYV